jgi:predicted Rossmann fold flavoprotein
MVVVVGAGAAGLIAAKRAAELGARVTLLEKSARAGLKILISGGGKCNLTHAGSIKDIKSAFRPNESRFLTPSFYRFFNDEFLSILHDAGMKTYARPDGRIFPVEPDNARDVVAILERSVRTTGAELITGMLVTGLVADAGRVTGVRIAGVVRPADRVIVAVGGSSYPATGTTGDGWRWAVSVGHTVVPLRAALAPLYLDKAEPDWSGVALRDVILRARISAGGKEYARRRGDLLFTHRGISGPAALGISREIGERIASGIPAGGSVEVDLVPDVAFEQLQTDVKNELGANPRKTVGGIIEQYLPHRLAGAFAVVAQFDAQTRGANLPSKTLNRLVTFLKGWPLGGVRSVPLERGEVVAGGVSLDEVNPQTMESRLIKGLYLCGEVLDIAGPVGGYNLQAAWSTGFVAGESAATLGGESNASEVD